MTNNLVVPPRSAAVSAYLDKLKPTIAPSGSGTGRLIFALDATASRQPAWDVAAQLQHEMFDAVTGVGTLFVQLAYFRGYDECRTSKWFLNAAELHRVMRGISCDAGETQIERILSHAIRETSKSKVSALIYVGDAMEEKLDRLARLAGELGKLGVPIFVLHESHNGWWQAVATDDTVADAFRQLAQLSGGVYLPFDRTGIAQLRELLGAIAVYAVGGHSALKALAASKGGAALRLTHQMRGHS
jgi:hypothetical protein